VKNVGIFCKPGGYFSSVKIGLVILLLWFCLLGPQLFQQRIVVVFLSLLLCDLLENISVDFLKCSDKSVEIHNRSINRWIVHTRTTYEV